MRLRMLPLCVVVLALGCRDGGPPWDRFPIPHHGGHDHAHGPHAGPGTELHGVTLADRVCPHRLRTVDPLPERPVAQLIQAGFGFVEGPVWLAPQSVLVFSDMDFPATNENGSPGRIRRYTPASGFDVFVEQANSNGLALDVDGAVIAGSQDVRSFSRFDPNTGERTVLDLRYEGRRFNSPNDLVVRSDGTIYFTDPDWQLAPRTAEIGFTGVFVVNPERTSVSLVTDSLDKPNGIALSPDEQTLYVGSLGNDVLAFPVAEDGSTGPGEVFATPGSSDGMVVDCAGNLYVTAEAAVQVYAPDGTKRGVIEAAHEPSNLAFGGPNRTTLFITAQEALYSIELAVPGLPY